MKESSSILETVDNELGDVSNFLLKHFKSVLRLTATIPFGMVSYDALTRYGLSGAQDAVSYNIASNLLALGVLEGFFIGVDKLAKIIKNHINKHGES